MNGLDSAGATPPGDLPDKPSQAEGDVGDDELSATGDASVTDEVTGDSPELEVNDG